MDPENEIPDQELSQLLQNVPIPDDLKRNLRAIPFTDVSSQVASQPVQIEQVKTEPSAMPRISRRWVALVATTAAMLVLWLSLSGRFDLQAVFDQRANRSTEHNSSPQTPEAGKRIAAGDPASAEVTDVVTTGDLAANEYEQRMKQIASDLAVVQQSLDQWQFQQKQDRWQREKSTLLTGMSVKDLDPLDVSSMVVALSEQSSLAYGGSIDRVSQSMAKVALRFPDSRGAEIAKQFLADSAE